MIKEEKKVFKPNATTSLLVQSSLKIIKKKSDILDLGCGTGYVGLTIAKNTKIKNNYFFSDLSNKAINLCKTNAKKIDVNGNDLWGSQGIAVINASGRQEDPQLVSDGQGGAYVIWKDYRDEPDDGDFYAQRILSDGTLAWNLSGIALTNVPGKQSSPNLQLFFKLIFNTVVAM